MLLSEQQSLLLQSVFENNPVPSTAVKQQLAKELSVSYDKVSHWFKDKRYRIRQESSLGDVIIREFIAS